MARKQASPFLKGEGRVGVRGDFSSIKPQRIRDSDACPVGSGGSDGPEELGVGREASSSMSQIPNNPNHPNQPPKPHAAFACFTDVLLLALKLKVTCCNGR